MGALGPSDGRPEARWLSDRRASSTILKLRARGVLGGREFEVREFYGLRTVDLGTYQRAPGSRSYQLDSCPAR